MTTHQDHFITLPADPDVAVAGTPHAPAAPVHQTLDAVFDATVGRHPHRRALEAEDGTRTYADLYRDVSAMASRLRSAGIGAGDRVGIRVPSGTLALYTSLLAVLHIGAAYVPVDADDPEARAQLVWDEAGVCAVIGAGGRIEPRTPGADRVGFAHPDSDAWIIFTSGSTGKPKGVAVTHANAAAFVAAEAELLHVGPEDRVAAGLSVGFDASCEEMWLAWANGAALVAAPRAVVRSGAAYGAWLAAHAVTVVSTVPTLASLWDTADLEHVRLLVLGGEACSDELGWRLAAEREVWNTYGPTEATVVSTAARILPGRTVTIGEPLAGWEVAVVDPDGTPVADGVEGELVIAGAGLGRYLDPELDTTRYAALPQLGWDRAYRTGDMVRRTPEGLAFVGRTDDQVKIGGRRIELNEITAHLLAVPGVRSGVCVAQRTEAGHRVLVAYVVSDIDTATLRAALSEHLPQGLVPIIAVLDALPMSSSGKVDRKALPWPLEAGGDSALDGTAGWLAGLWQRHLGVRPDGVEDDFFALGGSSLAAAKLVSELRRRFPEAAVAHVYTHRTLGELAAHLDSTTAVEETAAAAPQTSVRRRLRWRHLAALASLGFVQLPVWAIGIGAYDDLAGWGVRVSWWWLVLAYLVFLSPAGRIGIAALSRVVLLRGVRPGRYPRRSGVAVRVWLLDRIGDAMHVASYGGTPFAARAARLMGARVGAGAALGTVPSPASWVSIGAGATIEGDVDLHGWVVEGDELIIGEVRIGDYARVASRTMLMPGAVVGDYAEVQPASLVDGAVPAGESWGGSPARALGAVDSAQWPPTARPSHGLRWRLVYSATLTALSLVPALGGIAVVGALAWLHGGWHHLPQEVLSLDTSWLYLPLLAALFITVDAVVIALLARLLGRWIRPGWHRAGVTTWAFWTHEGLMSMSRTGLFPLYCSSVTRTWLRLAGVRIGRGTEISTAIGLGPLVRFGELAFVADDVVFNVVRAHRGWIQLREIEVGDGVFLGNGAVIDGGTTLGAGSLVGVQTVPPADVPPATSWFGVPALEFPRTADCTDASRTVAPPARLRVARSCFDVVRILLPTTVSLALAVTMFCGLDRLIASAGSMWALVVAWLPVWVATGLVAVTVTAAVKWTLIGRYRAGEHPFWSAFVWRDEIVNSTQESLAGPWLLDDALGTPVMTPYLRLMGTTVGRDVWCDTLTISEFDVVTLGDGVTANRRCCIESHLFHDRLMRIGDVRLGEDVTVGASTAVLPDTTLERAVVVGARSVVLRGERLPAGTRWVGAPVAPEAAALPSQA